MGFFGRFVGVGARTLLQADTITINQVRGKAKKLAGSAKNAPRKLNQKHRGLKKNEGHYVSENTILALQFNQLPFHPGLNVGFGKNGTLFALEAGRVMLSVEKTNVNWDHTWIQRLYAGVEQHTMVKTHINVIPFKQHNRFKLIDEV